MTGEELAGTFPPIPDALADEIAGLLYVTDAAEAA